MDFIHAGHGNFPLGAHHGQGSGPLLKSVLVANRGEIAVRIIRTLQQLGIRSIAVYSDADAGALHVQMADQAVRLGPAPATESYLNIEAVLRAAVESGAAAVHPGYGFLSENARFAEALAQEGITFIGPPVEALAIMGDKITAKNHVAASGVPTVPGYAGETGHSPTDQQLREHVSDVGYPILIKPSAGGGGKGMVEVESEEQLDAALATARRVAANAFGDDTLFLERLVRNPRHIEVQVLADEHGNVIHLGERECSLQRRHQKVIEEAPSALLEGLSKGAEIRERMGRAACDAARSVNYTGVGTIEFLVSDDNPEEFFFMEMNTRLQVEHPVTEEVTGVDLVEQQLRVAAGLPLELRQEDIQLVGHAIEARIYAEDPRNGFLPATGTVEFLDEYGHQGMRINNGAAGYRPLPESPRIDSSLYQGQVIGADYDPMLAKVIVKAATRAEALTGLQEALKKFVLLGVRNNVEYLLLLLADEDVQAGRLDTTLIERRLGALPFADVDDLDLALAALAADQVFLTWQANSRTALTGDVSQPMGSGWTIPDSFRLGERPARRRTVRFEETLIDLEISRESRTSRTGGIDQVIAATVSAPEKAPMELEVTISAYGPVRLSTQGQERWYLLSPSVPYAAQPPAREVSLWFNRDGFSAQLDLLGREAALEARLARLGTAEGTADPRVLTPMPGTVVAVVVSEGQHVTAGQHLLSVEAMKMEHQLAAPISGTVHLHASTGDQVKNKAVVATIQAEKPTT